VFYCRHSIFTIELSLEEKSEEAIISDCWLSHLRKVESKAVSIDVRSFVFQKGICFILKGCFNIFLGLLTNFGKNVGFEFFNNHVGKN
jgi:hypothetical protein